MKEGKEKIKDWFTKAGQTVSNKLNCWINPLSSNVKKRGFLIIGISIGVACIMFIVRALQQEGVPLVLTVDPITRPLDIHHTDSVPQEDTELFLIRQYNRMIWFKEQVEKLNASGDKHRRDSLMNAHPTLRDSLNEFLKQYY